MDTPDSSLVTGDPKGGDTLSWRATLLAMQLATDQSQRALAAKAGVPSSQLSVTDTELAGPTVLAPLPTAAAKAADSTAKPYAVTVGTDDTVPIITIQTAAPDRAGAVRFAQAAVSTLQAGASPKDTATLQGLRVLDRRPDRNARRRRGHRQEEDGDHGDRRVRPVVCVHADRASDRGR